MQFHFLLFALSEEEFKEQYLTGYTNLLQPGGAGASRKRTHHINVRDLPAEVDWRDKVQTLPSKHKQKQIKLLRQIKTLLMNKFEHDQRWSRKNKLK